MPIPINTLMRTVVANPDAYADAFPVAEPPRPADTMTCWGDPSRSHREILERMAGLTTAPFPDMSGPAADLSGAQLTPEAFDAMRNALLGAELENTRRLFFTTPFSRDSVAQRVLDRAHERVAGSYSMRMVPTVGGWRGERPTRSTDGETQFIIDYTVPYDEIRYIGGPNPPQRVRVTGLRGHRLEQYAHGDGTGEQAWGDSDQTERLQLLAGQRPAHYRTRPGRCACGFESLHSADMTAHLDQRPVHTENGLRYVGLCECGESRWCRRVALATNRPVSFVEPTLNPSGPVLNTVWLCDECCQRRGIR